MPTAPSMLHRPDHLAAARTAISDVGSTLVQLIRRSNPVEAALGHWGMGELACHISHAVKVDTDAMAGRPLPIAELTPAAVAVGNDEELAADPQRDLDVLATRIETGLEEFREISSNPGSDRLTWIGGVQLPTSAVACHLLEELLVHGFDVASANKRSWIIAPEHAALAILGAALPIVAAADPMAFVQAERARGFRGRLDIRPRGHEPFSFVFEDGLYVGDKGAGAADVHVSIDPSSLLLFMLGRVTIPRSVLRGKLVVWGRRPWVLPRMLAVITPP